MAIMLGSNFYSTF